MSMPTGDMTHLLTVVAPVGRDAQLICDFVSSLKVVCRPYKQIREVPENFLENASVLIVAEEALDKDAVQCLSLILENQPTWSDIPTIVLTGSGVITDSSVRMAKVREPLRNLTLLERPLRSVTLTSAVQTALRAREKQYQMRDYLAERKIMLEQLEQSYAELETTVAHRTATLRNLSQRLLRLQDEERRRIARDLHDSTGQVLTALKISLAVFQQRFGDLPAAKGSLAEIISLTDQALQEIRTMSYLLHPPTLDHSGFISAARWYVSGVAERSGIKAELDLPENELRLPDTVERVLFRVLQESLTNVLRHANADRVRIRFVTNQKSAILEIADDGEGIPSELLARLKSMETDGGVGLAGMRERIHELNGDLKLESDNEGTTVKVTVPLEFDPSKWHIDESHSRESALDHR
ncbi:MAG TPA: sensor histidine kinase [Terriglobales bacterium]|nr:sensor histidine kinase [Terriglobales bacterium]